MSLRNNDDKSNFTKYEHIPVTKGIFLIILTMVIIIRYKNHDDDIL